MQSKGFLTSLRPANSEQTAGFKNASLGTVKAGPLSLFLGPVVLLLGLVLALVSPVRVTRKSRGATTASYRRGRYPARC